MVVYKGKATLLANWLIILKHVKLQCALKISGRHGLTRNFSSLNLHNVISSP